MKNRITILIILLFCLIGCASRKTEMQIDCCSVIGLNITNITGKTGIDCGNINMWPFPPKKMASKERARKKSLDCVRSAELENFPFIVTYQTIIPPDVSYSETYIFTELGERVLLYMGEQGDSGFEVSVSKCESIELETNGKIKSNNCNSSNEIFEKLKAKY